MVSASFVSGGRVLIVAPVGVCLTGLTMPREAKGRLPNLAGKYACDPNRFGMA